MKFKLDDTFKHYWPPLPEEKRIILEKSILEEGLRDNLIVWKEKNILLDGHQRLGILTKHGIGYEDRITYLSFPDEVHAKHWVHVTQAARRGDAPQFLSICHVLEFEPIYREEAKQRQREHGGTAPGKHSVANGDEVLGKGRFTKFMERDSAASEHSIQRALYIRTHDSERFDVLHKMAASGQAYDHGGGMGRGKDGTEISIHLEWSKVKAMVDAKAAGVKLDPATLEKFTSSNTVRDFAETVSKFKPSASVQKTAAEAIISNDDAANKNYVEDAIVRRMPKKKATTEADKPALLQLENSMEKIADGLCSTIGEMKHLQEMRHQPGFGDGLYFRALANATNLRAAFAEWVVMAELINKKGNNHENKKDETRGLLRA